MNVYDEALASLVNRNILINSIVVALSFIILLLVWCSPFIEKAVQKKSAKKQKKKKQKSKKEKIKFFALCTLVTVIILPIGCFNIADLIGQYKNMKEDIENQSYITYKGKYELDTDIDNPRHGVLSDLIIDLRCVQLEGSDEYLWLDMSKVNEGLVKDYGIYEGTIVYAEKSGYILKNDAARVGDEW